MQTEQATPSGKITNYRAYAFESPSIEFYYEDVQLWCPKFYGAQDNPHRVVLPDATVENLLKYTRMMGPDHVRMVVRSSLKPVIVPTTPIPDELVALFVSDRAPFVSKDYEAQTHPGHIYSIRRLDTQERVAVHVCGEWRALASWVGSRSHHELGLKDLDVNYLGEYQPLDSWRF